MVLFYVKQFVLLNYETLASPCYSKAIDALILKY